MNVGFLKMKMEHMESKKAKIKIPKTRNEFANFANIPNLKYVREDKYQLIIHNSKYSNSFVAEDAFGDMTYYG